MKSEKYWEKRAITRLTESEKQSDEYIRKVKKIYTNANREIKKEIATIYKNYSKETGIDVNTLKELLSKKETDKFWNTMKGKDLKQYVQNNYKSRINRLEQLQGQIYAKAKEIYKDELNTVYGHYKGVINNSYYKTVYDTQIGTGYDFAFNKLDENMINTVLNEKWYGGNYSQRIWNNTELLANKLSESLGSHLISGKPSSTLIREISDMFGVANYYAERLIRTETNHFNAEAEALAYEELGVKKYVFVATLDNRTSKICQEHDHKVYELDKRKEGINFPPMHPNCRSTYRAYLGEEEEKNLKRRARNPITGKNEVIDNMSYEEWKEKYVTNGKKNDIIKQQKKDKIPNNIEEFYHYVTKNNMIDKLTTLKQDTNGVVRGQELNKILGYDRLPRKIPKEEFEVLEKTAKYGKLYRGLQADTKELGEKYVDEFNNGNFFAGKTGVYGRGTYVAYGKNGLELVKNTYTNENGQIIEMLLDNDAKTIKYSELFKMQQKELNNLGNSVAKEFKDFILSDAGYYASIKGYDAIILDDIIAEMNNQPYIVILNREKVIVHE